MSVVVDAPLVFEQPSYWSFWLQHHQISDCLWIQGYQFDKNIFGAEEETVLKNFNLYLQKEFWTIIGLSFPVLTDYMYILQTCPKTEKFWNFVKILNFEKYFLGSLLAVIFPGQSGKVLAPGHPAIPFKFLANLSQRS